MTTETVVPPAAFFGAMPITGKTSDREIFLNFFSKSFEVFAKVHGKKSISDIVWALWRVREVESYALSKFHSPPTLGDPQNTEKTIRKN